MEDMSSHHTVRIHYSCTHLAMRNTVHWTPFLDSLLA